MRVSRRSFVATGLAGVGTHLSAQAQTVGSDRSGDWMLHPELYAAPLVHQQDDKVTLSNGILSRAFCSSPNAAKVSFVDETNGANLLRAIRAEAESTGNDMSIASGCLYGAPQEMAYSNQ